MAKQVKIEWTPSASNTIAPTSQVVERSATENGTYSVIHTASNNTTGEYIDTNVSDGETWWYKVGAVFASGNTIYLSADDITVSDGGGSTYDPSVTSLLAIKPTSTTPTDQSSSARTTSAVSGNTAPTVVGGNLVFDGTQSLQLSSQLDILAAQAWTLVVTQSFDDFAPSVGYYFVLGVTGFQHRLDAAGNLEPVVGTTTSANLVAANTVMTAGELTTIIFRKAADNTCTMQIDSPTQGLSAEIDLNGGNPNDGNAAFLYIGDQAAFADRELQGKIRGFAVEPQILTESTTPKLSEVQTWTES